MTEPIYLDALGPSGPFRARKRVEVPDVSGTPVAELSMVPKLFVSRTLAALHRGRSMPQAQRLAAMAEAGRIFAEETIAGLDFDAYERMVQHAQQLGADAVIGMRYEANDFAEGVTEGLAYGTAVKLMPAGRAV